MTGLDAQGQGPQGQGPQGPPTRGTVPLFPNIPRRRVPMRADQIRIGERPDPPVEIWPSIRQLHLKEQAAEDEQFAQVILQVTKDSAEFQANLQKLGVDLGGGISPTVIRENLPKFKEAWERRKIENLDLKNTNPTLYRELTDIKFASVAYDVVEDLSTWDRMWGDLSRGWLIDVRNKIGARAVSGSGSWTSAGEWVGPLGSGSDLTQKEWEEIDRLDKEIEGSGTLDNFFSPALEFTGQQLENLWSSKEEAIIGAAIGSAVPGAGTLAGGVRGLTYGYMGNTYAVVSGGAYIEMRRIGLTHEEAVPYAKGIGAGSTVLELLGARALSGLSPAKLKSLLETFGTGARNKLTLGQLAKEAGKRALVGGVGETATETAQTALEIIGEDRAVKSAISTDNLEPKVRRHPETGEIIPALSSRYMEGQLLPQLAETAIFTAKAMTVLGPLAGGARSIARFGLAKKQVKRTQEFIASLENEGVKTLVDRAPDAAAAWLASRVKGSALENLKVSVSDLRRVLGELGMDDKQIAELLPDAQRAFDLLGEFPEGDNHVFIPTSHFLKEVVTRPGVYQALAPVIMAEDDHMSLEQIIESKKKVAEEEAELHRASEKADLELLSTDEAKDEQRLDSGEGIPLSELRAREAATAPETEVADTEAAPDPEQQQRSEKAFADSDKKLARAREANDPVALLQAAGQLRRRAQNFGDEQRLAQAEEIIAELAEQGYELYEPTDFVVRRPGIDARKSVTFEGGVEPGQVGARFVVRQSGVRKDGQIIEEAHGDILATEESWARADMEEEAGLLEAAFPGVTARLQQAQTAEEIAAIREEFMRDGRLMGDTLSEVENADKPNVGPDPGAVFNRYVEAMQTVRDAESARAELEAAAETEVAETEAAPEEEKVRDLSEQIGSVMRAVRDWLSGAYTGTELTEQVKLMKAMLFRHYAISRVQQRADSGGVEPMPFDEWFREFGLQILVKDFEGAPAPAPKDYVPPTILTTVPEPKEEGEVERLDLEGVDWSAEEIVKLAKRAESTAEVAPGDVVEETPAEMAAAEAVPVSITPDAELLASLGITMAEAEAAQTVIVPDAELAEEQEVTEEPVDEAEVAPAEGDLFQSLLPKKNEEGEYVVPDLTKDGKPTGKRHWQMAAGNKALQAGKITRDQWDQLINIYRPIRPFKSVAEPATPADLDKGLNKGQRLRVDAHRNILGEGERTALRIDIPAARKGVGVVVVHQFKPGTTIGDPIGYDSVGHVTNAEMGKGEDAEKVGRAGSKLQEIAQGEPKDSLGGAVINGDFVPSTPEEVKALAEKALNDPEWVQVGMDPERHAYFYDRKTLEPIVSADEVLQIGGMVLAKNPRYADREQFLYQDEGTFDQGDFEFNESDFRPEVVAWAKERFGDRVAPNGKPVWQNFTRWFGDSKVVDAEGKPMVVFHGTTHVFESFDQRQANIENDMGKGFYLTTSPKDAGANYAGIGPDLTNRIESRAEQIEAESDIDEDAAREQAREELVGQGDVVIPAYVSLQNPVIIGGENDTFIEMELVEDEDGDIIDERGPLVDLIQAIRDISVRFDDAGSVEGFVNSLLEEGVDGIRASRLVELHRQSENYATDDLGRLASNEMLRQAFEEAGYDGVIDSTISRFSMEGVGEGDSHVIAFAPNQIKSTQNIGDFSADERILYQTATVRSGKETLAEYGLDPGKRYRVREVAAALEARQRDKWGPLAKDDRSDEAANKIAEWMAEEVLFEMHNPEFSGVGWYSEKFKRALDRMGDLYPELKDNQSSRNTFTLLVAITSDGQSPQENLDQAADIYSEYRESNRFSGTRGTARGESVRGNLAKIQQLFDTMGVDEAHEYLMQERTVKELKAIAESLGYSFSTSYQVSVKMPMAAVTLGPKLGAFYANLMGSHGYLTMDRWWSRTFNRYRGTLLMHPTPQSLKTFREMIGKPELSDEETISATVEWRKSYEKREFHTRLAELVGSSEPGKKTDKAKWMAKARKKAGDQFEALLLEHNRERAGNTIYKNAFENLEDSPFGARDRTFMLDAVGRAQKLLKERGSDLSIADIQAILWYYEKKLYGELGAVQSAKISFDEAAQRHVTNRETDASPLQGQPEGLEVVRETPTADVSQEPGEAEFQAAEKEAAVEDGPTLLADDERGPRGSYRRSVTPDGIVKRIITLVLGATNASTLLHEAAHLFFDARVDLVRGARRDGRYVQPTVVLDLEAMFDAMDVGDPASDIHARIAVWDAMSEDEITVRHEAVARNFERYMFAGVAPTSDLVKTFRRVSNWMESIYGSAEGINEAYKAAESKRTGRPFTKNLFELTPEVEQVFARLFAARQDVTAALSGDEGSIGVGYGQEVDERILDDAAAEVGQKLVADGVRVGLFNPQRIESRIGKDARRVRRAIRAQELEEAKKDRVHRLRKWLSTGVFVDEDGVVIEDETYPKNLMLSMFEGKHRLNTATVRKIMPGSATGDFGAVTTAEGVDPEQVRIRFGYSNSTEMLSDLRDAPRIQEAVRERTQERMSKEFAELSTPIDIQNTVKAAIAGEAAQEAITDQLDEVLGKKGNSRLTLHAARQVARRRIRRLPLKELRSDRFEESARRNRRLARERWGEGDTAGAADAFRAELVDTATVREISRARVSTENSKRKQLKRFAGRRDRALAKEHDTRYFAVGRELLASVGLINQRQPGDQVETLRRRDPEFFDAISTYIAPFWAEDGAGSLRTDDVQSLTLEQYEKVMDTLDLLWDRSKTQKRVQLNKKSFDRTLLVNDMVAQLGEVGRLEEYSGIGEELGFWNEIEARLARAEHAMIRLDGGNRGIWWRMIYKPIRNAFDRATSRQREHLIRLRKSMDRVNALSAGQSPEIAASKKQGEFDHTFGTDSEAGQSVTHELIAVLVNLGTQSGRDRMMIGRGWSERMGKDQKGPANMVPMQNFLNRMVAEGVLEQAHFDLAQEILDTFEEILPDFQKATMAVEGVYANELEAIPLVVRGGDREFRMRGGYVPARYAPNSETKSKQRPLQKAASHKLQFGNSSTKDRVEGFSDVISLRLTDTLFAFQDHIRFAEVAPVAKQIRDLLVVGETGGENSRKLGDILQETNPIIWNGVNDNKSVIYTLLSRATTGQLQADAKEYGKVTKFLRSIRNSFGLLQFSTDVKNALENLSGVAQARHMMGTKWMAYGFLHMDGKFAIDPSRGQGEGNDFMKNRLSADTQQVIATDINPADTQTELEKKVAYLFPRWTQNIVDIAVWNGGYQRYLSVDRRPEMSDAEAHEAAIEYANSVVRLIHSSDIIDVGGYEGVYGEVGRLMTQWFSWANGQQQLTKTLWTKTMLEGGVFKYPRFAYGFIMQHWVTYAVGGVILNLSRGIPDDEEDWLDFAIDAFLYEPLKFTAHAAAPVLGDTVGYGISTALGKHSFKAGTMPVVSKSTKIIDDVISLDSETPAAMAELAYHFRYFLPPGLREMATITGLSSRPIRYAGQVVAGDIDPEGPGDAVRGLVTGKTSPKSRNR